MSDNHQNLLRSSLNGSHGERIKVTVSFKAHEKSPYQNTKVTFSVNQYYKLTTLTQHLKSRLKMGPMDSIGFSITRENEAIMLAPTSVIGILYKTYKREEDDCLNLNATQFEAFGSN